MAEAPSRAPSGSTHLHLAIIYAWPYDLFCTEIQTKCLQEFSYVYALCLPGYTTLTRNTELPMPLGILQDT